MDEDKISRRQFFRLKPLEVIRAAAGAPKSQAAAITVRPPGAIDEEAFVETCERCLGCSSACPHGVIEHFGPTAGRAEGTPFLRPEEAPCRWCPSMDCIHACPSGALALLDGATLPPPIALAEITLDKCLNSQGTLCDTCAVYCPATIRAIRMEDRKPVLDAEKCTGCGLCAYACEADPKAIRILRLEPGASCRDS